MQALALLLLPLTVAVLKAVVSALEGFPERFGAWWEWVLDRKWGSRWPIFASILPPCIPIARSLEECSPAWVRHATVAALLLAIAVVQLYGQQRNNRDRLKTEDRFSDLVDRIEHARAGAIAILNEVREGRRDAEEARAEAEEGTIAILNEIREGRRDAEEARGFISDAINSNYINRSRT